MSLIYGIEAIHQSASANLPHVLGFQTARSAPNDTLFEIWNAATNAGIKAAVDLDGKYYSAAWTAGDIPYAVTGGVANVRRLDSLGIGSAYNVLQTNSGATAPEWTNSPTLTGITMSGPIILPNGSTTAPALRFTNDPDTGMYLISAGLLGFSVGNTTKLTLNGGAEALFGDLITASASGVKTDLIIEKTSTSGVTIDSVKHKDGFVQTGTGAAGGPAHSFQVEVTTGYFWPGASAIGVALGGTEYQRFTTSGLMTDNIIEYTGATGVTIDSVLLKDGSIGETGSGITSAWLDGTVYVDDILEYTGAHGVVIDGVQMVDGFVKCATIGAAPSPVFTFTAVHNDATGLFQQGAAALGISCGGAETARFTASGIMTDNILEYTGATGVTIDTLLVKDGGLGDGTTVIGIDGTQVLLSCAGTNRVGCTTVGTTVYDDTPFIMEGETRWTANINTSTGTQDDVARVNDRSLLRFNGTTTVTGITNGTVGEVLFIAAQETVTVKHEDSGSTAVNRFYTKTAGDVTITDSVKLFMYMDVGSGVSRWCEV